MKCSSIKQGMECANCSADVETTIEVTNAVDNGMRKELWCLACLHREIQNRLKDEAREDQSAT